MSRPLRVGQVSHYMPPHIGGLQRVGAALEVAVLAAGHEHRWVASASPAGATGGAGRVRVPCWDGLNTRLGLPLPIWGRDGREALRALSDWADVLIVHGCLYPTSAAAVAAARRRELPVLLVQHTGPARYQRLGLDAVQEVGFRSLGRAVLLASRRVIAATPAAAALMDRLGVPARTILNGVDAERFRPPTAAERAEARARLGVRGRVALFVGRLIDKKGAGAVLALASRLPAITFLAVGEGPMAARFRAGPGNLIWREKLPWSAMPGVYHAADLLALPARGEGFPLVVQEAMACGLPALLLREEAFARPLVSAGAALGVSPGVDAWARAVVEPSEAALRRVGQRGREEALRFRPEANARAYLEELASLTASTSAAMAAPRSG